MCTAQVPACLKRTMEGGLTPFMESIATDLVNTAGKPCQVPAAWPTAAPAQMRAC